MPNPLENIAAKTAGKAAAVGARAGGLVGVFNKLAEQHKQAAILLKRAEATDDPAKWQDLWGTIRRDLLSHERGELSVVYPELANHAATEDIAKRHDAEAETLEAAIGEIDVIGYGGPNWATLMQRLISLVEQHVDEEENDFFPRAQEALGKEAVVALEAPFMAAHERVRETLA